MGHHKKEKKKKHKSGTNERSEDEDEHPSLDQSKKVVQPTVESSHGDKHNDSGDGPKEKKSKKHKKEKKSKKDHKSKKEKKRRKRESESAESEAENDASDDNENDDSNRASKENSKHVSPKLTKLVDYDDVGQNCALGSNSNGVNDDMNLKVSATDNVSTHGSEDVLDSKAWIAAPAVADFEEDDEMTEHPMICNLVPRQAVSSSVPSAKVTSLKGQIVSSSSVVANGKTSTKPDSLSKTASVILHGWIMW